MYLPEVLCPEKSMRKKMEMGQLSHQFYRLLAASLLYGQKPPE